LSETAPTGLTSSGDLPDGTYITSYGTFLIANFGSFTYMFAPRLFC
jgi:hypothetical protein